MTMIVQSSQLEALCQKIETAGRFSMDLEFIPERTYDPELCLVQIATDEEAFIIDPLKIKDLNPLWEFVADPDTLVVLHAAEHDLDLVYRLSGLVPQNVIDTQIAAGFAGFGFPIGYGKLLSQLLNVQISKTESFTDWLIRPLSDSQIEYALDDVRHILPMYDKLVAELDKIDRFAWAEEECKKYTKQKRYERDRSKEFYRVKGASALSRRGLAVLRALVEWRDKEAQRVNRPTRTITQDNILLELARRPPKAANEIDRIRGARPDQIRAHGAAIISAIQAGLATPEQECPFWPAFKNPPKRDTLHVDVLFTFVKVIAHEMELAPELVTTREELQNVVRDYREKNLDREDHDILQGWRYEMAGKMLLDVLGGASMNVTLASSGLPVRIEIGTKAGAEQD